MWEDGRMDGTTLARPFFFPLSGGKPFSRGEPEREKKGWKAGKNGMGCDGERECGSGHKLGIRMPSCSWLPVLTIHLGN